MIPLLPLYQTDFVSVEINQDFGFIQITWLKQPHSDLYRKETRLIVAYALKHNISRALFDVRKRDYLDMRDQNWLVHDIFPRLKGRRIRLAYLVSAVGVEIMDTYHIHASINKNPELKECLELDIFLDKEDAMKWLFESEITPMKP